MRRIRTSDYLSLAFVCLATFFLCVGLVKAQSQDALNATFTEKFIYTARMVDALSAKVDKLQDSQTYGLYALIANLGAHFFQIQSQRKKRGLPPDESV